MAEVYHFDCRPTNSQDSDFKTLRSKFDGICKGCGEAYEKEAKIAYFGNKDYSSSSNRSASTAPAGKDHSGELSALRNELNQLKRDLVETRLIAKKAADSLVDLNGWILIAGDIDWKSLPMKERSKPTRPEPTATPQQVAKEFKGQLISPAPDAAGEEAY